MTATTSRSHTERTQAADQIPTFVHVDRTLRVKVIDACGMTCVFCHNEGTPVAADNRGVDGGPFRDRGSSGRVSVFLATNGARFVPTTISPDDSFARALATLRRALLISEVHLTGGEPTLHPQIASIVRTARAEGMRVCMTSNGENGARTLASCGREGLDRVNFSIFGTTAAELASVQDARFADVARADRKIQALRDSIRVALASGIRCSANIVVPSYDHAPRVRRLLDEYSTDVSIRLLNSLADGRPSIDAIEGILDDLAAVPVARHLTAGASGARTIYRLPDGRPLVFKQIRPVRLPDTCAGCQFNNDTDCPEGYYGVRLYRDTAGTFQVGVCLQRMDLCLPLDEFVGSDLWAEIRALRQAEYGHLVQQYRSDTTKGTTDARRV